jgi:hypothetical protein
MHALYLVVHMGVDRPMGYLQSRELVGLLEVRP